MSLAHKMAEMLKRLEWSGAVDEYPQRCPRCAGAKPAHDQECDLEALLDDIREREQEIQTGATDKVTQDACISRHDWYYLECHVMDDDDERPEYTKTCARCGKKLKARRFARPPKGAMIMGGMV